MKFDELKMAYKRALHFSLPFDGPHSTLKSPVGNNYARMLYAEEDFLGKLIMLHYWAGALNRCANARRVADDLELREAFTSFLSLCFIDPRGLSNA